MRNVLLCVRSARAARDVAAVAARLGLATAVRTATSEPEVLLRLAEKPADIVLAEAALVRSDTARFTRRVLARAPRAALVLFGAERTSAAAVIAAGARGLISSSDQEAACVVAKTLLLLQAPGRRLAEPGLPGGGRTSGDGGRRVPGSGAPESAEAGPQSGASTVVPAQREVDPAPVDPPVAITSAVQPGEQGAPPTAVTPAPPTGGEHPASVLTEREAQVLRAMADGKSNAEIGRELYLSEDTVKTYARRIFRKLGVRDRAHAVATGFRAGLVA
ncbi:MAG TPA: response regulator transcription factor [Micromonospora sp.]|nr:response regulator transcription factor [Micromonospora sp.]